MGKGNYLAHPDPERAMQWYLDYEPPEHELAPFLHALCARFKSFGPCSKWLDRESYALLQNRLFFVGLADNAVFLIPRPDSFVAAEQRRHFPRYRAGIEQILVDQFGAQNVRIRTSAWTSVSLEKKGA